MNELHFGTPEEFEAIKQDYTDAANSFDADIVAEQALIDQYKEVIPEIEECANMEALFRVNYQLETLRNAITASAKVYTLYSENVEKYLDSGHGACLLRSDGALAVVTETLNHDDGVKYRIHAYGVMPNHVHVIVEPFDGVSLRTVVQEWKSVIGHHINRLLGRSGALWQADYYNHIIRTAREYGFQMDYVFRNNVVASWRLGCCA